MAELEELQKERNFVKQTEDQRRVLEKEVKSRYSISDWKSDDPYLYVGGLGYKIDDKKTGQTTYFSPNSRLTLEKRYLEKGDRRQVVETALDLFARVAVNIAEADLKYNPNADVKETAEGFLEALLYKEVMPNTPTLCNAGRQLQQLSACFVLPIEDYMATDDIGEDPEKQGAGIADSLRQMSMIHKSGGGTGFNFGHLRPRSDRISTTFGTSSGPVVFIKPFDTMTEAVNQGGFRRGANMGILPYNHPDVFEFVSEKARNGTLKNFNLSVGVTSEFMKLAEDDGYFTLINPKGENTGVPLEKRVWTELNLLKKGTDDYKRLHGELEPSLIIDEDGVSIINTYNQKKVGKIDNNGKVLISARSLFDYIAENAWVEGCPGILFLDRIQANNTTPNISKQEATNPCGEQPLPPYEACNLLAINLSDCFLTNLTVQNPRGLDELYNRVDWNKIEKRARTGVHFLDNTIDMSKYPFQKVYGAVHGNRRVGLGVMGWAEMLSGLGVAYDSPEAFELAKKLSSFVTEAGTKMSEELAEKRGTFPNWKGSVWEQRGRKLRNATITTIAPNGTTSMIADCNGGIEPYFKISYTKTCMDNTKLTYRIPGFINGLREIISDENELKRIIDEVDEKGSLENIAGIPEEIKIKYKAAHVISPKDHVRVQSAFQRGEEGKFGVHNAVSKTVNMPNSATIDDVRDVYMFAYKEGCIGTTIFRDGSKTGVLAGLEKKVVVELIQIGVDSSPILQKKAQSLKYKVKRPQNNDSLHVEITSDLYVDDNEKKAYFIPDEIFQNRAPLGVAQSVSFGQSGMDRTEILKSPNPNYSEFIQRLQSASSNEEEGLGPHRIKSIEYAVGVALEDALLRNGVIKRDKTTGVLFNAVTKSELRKVEDRTEEYNNLMSQVRIIQTDEREVVTGTNMKLRGKFICGDCGSSGPGAYTFQAGCHHPVCTTCGWVEGGGCG
jgi:ribonucleoside-diphosphate reductase alpha chain